MPQATDTFDAAYHGPPRKPDDVIARALANSELVRQLEDSLEAQRLGVPPVPFREMQAEAKRRDAARESARRTV